jgi:hypothetical protein
LQLLRSWLSPCQREQFEKSGYFDVVGCLTGREYRIYHNMLPPNVYEIDDAGHRKMGLCFAPVGPLVKGRRDARAKDCVGSEEPICAIAPR